MVALIYITEGCQVKIPQTASECRFSTNTYAAESTESPQEGSLTFVTLWWCWPTQELFSTSNCSLRCLLMSTKSSCGHAGKSGGAGLVGGDFGGLRRGKINYSIFPRRRLSGFPPPGPIAPPPHRSYLHRLQLPKSTSKGAGYLLLGKPTLYKSSNVHMYI